MTRHNQSKGLEPPFQCDYCGIEFDDHGELKEHKMHHLIRSNFQCTQCEYIGRAPNHLKQHMRTHVSPNEIIHIYVLSSYCPFMIIFKSQTKSNYCDICGRGFISATSLETHHKNHGNDVIAECYICKHRAASIAKLREHMRIEHVSGEWYLNGAITLI